MTTNNDDLTKLRAICHNLSVGNGNEFVLHIIPLDGVSWKDHPGFKHAIKAWKLKRNPIRQDWSRGWMSEIEDCLWLLPDFRRPTNQRRPYIISSHDHFRSYRLSVPTIQGQRRFAVVLRTPTIEYPEGTRWDSLSDLEKSYTDFMELAGLILQSHDNKSARPNDEAWVKFLVEYVWNHNRPPVKRGFACLSNLVLQSLRAIDNRIKELSRLVDHGDSATHNGSSYEPNSPKRKRSTKRGDARVKIIAALTKWHQYDGESCLKTDPIGNNKLARLAKVANSTVSKFFNDEFKGSNHYLRACLDAVQLIASLKMLNGDFQPSILQGNLIEPVVSGNDE